VNHYDVEKIKLIDLSIDCFNYLKQINFLSIQFFVDVLNANIDDAKLNLVFLFKNYEFVILIVVMNLTELSLNDVITDEIIKICYFLSVQHNY